MFTRQHYNAIAKVLSFRTPDTIHPQTPTRYRSVLIDDLVSILQTDNPNFDPERFKDACDA